MFKPDGGNWQNLKIPISRAPGKKKTGFCEVYGPAYKVQNITKKNRGQITDYAHVQTPQVMFKKSKKKNIQLKPCQKEREGVFWFEKSLLSISWHLGCENGCLKGTFQREMKI